MFLAMLLVLIVVPSVLATRPGRNGQVIVGWASGPSGNSPPAGLLVVSPQTGQVSMLRAPSNVRAIVLFSPRGLHQMLALTARGGYELLNSQMRVLRSVRFGFQPESWSPDGRWIAGIGPAGPADPGSLDVYVSRTDGSDARRLTHGARVVSVSWSSRNEIAVATAQSLLLGRRLVAGRILVMDPFGRHVRAIYSPEHGPQWGYPFAIDWSPNGQLLTFAAGRPSGPSPVRNFIVDREGHGTRVIRVKFKTGAYSTASWSPDGKALLWYTGDSIYLTATDGSDPRLLLNADTSAIPTSPTGLHQITLFDPAWQPL